MVHFRLTLEGNLSSEHRKQKRQAKRRKKTALRRKRPRKVYRPKVPPLDVDKMYLDMFNKLKGRSDE